MLASQPIHELQHQCQSRLESTNRSYRPLQGSTRSSQHHVHLQFDTKGTFSSYEEICHELHNAAKYHGRIRWKVWLICAPASASQLIRMRSIWRFVWGDGSSKPGAGRSFQRKKYVMARTNLMIELFGFNTYIYIYTYIWVGIPINPHKRPATHF